MQPRRRLLQCSCTFIKNPVSYREETGLQNYKWSRLLVHKSLDTHLRSLLERLVHILHDVELAVGRH